MNKYLKKEIKKLVLYKSEWVNLRKKTKKSSKKYDDSKGFVCEGLNGRKALVHS